MTSKMPIKMKAKLLFFVSYILHPKYPSYYLPAYMYFVYLQLKKLQSYFSAIPCPISLIQYYVDSNTEKSIDVNNTVIISDKTRTKLNDNSFNLAFINSNADKNFRIVHVLKISSIDGNDMLMSENLYHNVNKTKISNRMRLNSIDLKYIKIAKEAEVALINTQYEMNNEFIDLLLKNYFQTPRLLYKHDVFSINVNLYSPELACSSFQLLNLKELHFRCRKISTEQINDSLSGLFCINGETTLLQTPNVRCYLPLSIFQVCGSDHLGPNVKYENHLISKCPYGLENYMKSIEKAVMPFIPKTNLSSSLRPAFLLQGRKGIGKNSIINALASKLGIQIYKAECSDIQTNTSAQTESKLKNIFSKSKLCAPCFLVLNNFEIYGKDNDGNYDPRLINYFQTELTYLFNDNNFPIVLLCLSNTKDISTDLTRSFLETFTIDAPNQNERNDLLRWLMLTKNFDCDTPLPSVAAKTHGFLLGDLDALISHAEKNLYLSSDVKDSMVCLRKKDFDIALDLMQTSYSTSIGAPKVPKVLWSDVGGLQDLKHEIMRTINLPLQHPQLLKTIGLKRSGVLLYGPPGTGKTLIAKAVATECGLCFLSVKGPELLNMYVGQSEQNVRQVFERAREASPCIIFFDELDSLAPNRGISGDSGGVMDRVVSQLLSEMDGLNDATKTVFVIGATNRPDLLDPALLRPGRFDKLLYVGPCTDNNSKVGVLKALTRKFTLAADVKLEKIATSLPTNVTGADLYAVCSNAWFSAVRKTITDIEKDNIDDDELSAEMVQVTMKDFTIAAKELKPSINDEDMLYFQSLKQQPNK